jgi:hypothetical protein
LFGFSLEIQLDLQIMGEAGTAKGAEYVTKLADHAGKILLTTISVTASVPLVLRYFDQPLTALVSPYLPFTYLALISIVAPVCYALCIIVVLRWFHSSENIIKITSMGVFLLTLFIGISATELLRKSRGGGVVIDARETTPIIQQDRSLPMGTVVVIGPDGKTTLYKSDEVTEATLDSITRSLRKHR